MGGMEFKTAKFLEHLVIIILDCGDKLFSSSYTDMHALMGKPSACQYRPPGGRGAPSWPRSLEDPSFPERNPASDQDVPCYFVI